MAERAATQAQAVADRFGHFIHALKEAGLTAAEIAHVINHRAAKRGIAFRMQYMNLGPLQILDGSIDIDTAELLLQPTTVRPPDPEKCPHPHFPCPHCRGDICFMGQRPKSPMGVCRGCGSFLRTEGEPLTITLMTDEEVLALPDDDRIMLMRNQRKALDLINSRGGRKQ